MRRENQPPAARVGERVYNPCGGTGGFLAQAAEFMAARAKTGEGLPAGLSAEREVGNKTPLTLADFEGYFAKLPGGGSRTSRGL